MVRLPSAMQRGSQHRKPAIVLVMVTLAVAIGSLVAKRGCRQCESIHLRNSGGVSSLAFSADSSRLAVGGVNGFVEIYDVNTRMELASLDLDGASTLAAVFLPDPDVLYFLTVKRNSRPPWAYTLFSWQWQLEEPARVWNVSDFAEAEYCDVSPDGRMIAFLPNATLTNATLTLYKKANGGDWSPMKWGATPLAAATPSFDAIIRIDDKCNISVISTETLVEETIGELDKAKRYVQLASANGKVILGTQSGDVVSWDSRNAEWKELEKGNGVPARNLRVSNDGSLLVVLRRKTLHVWNLNNTTMIRRIEGRWVGTASAAISPDNGVVAVGFCEPPACKTVIRLLKIGEQVGGTPRGE